MNVAISIQISPRSLALIEKYKVAPREIGKAMQKGMTRALAVVSGRIQERRLSGKGPFPVSEHRLGEVTGNLKLLTRSTPAKIVSQGDNVAVEGAIGSSVFYAKFQEYGTRTLPARAPFRTGIKENEKYISQEIEKEVVASLKT